LTRTVLFEKPPRIVQTSLFGKESTE